MNKLIKISLVLAAVVVGCSAPKVSEVKSSLQIPEQYQAQADTSNSAIKPYRMLFNDPKLVSLIDIALKNNQELQHALQEIEIARNEVRARKGELLPAVGIGAAAEVEKVGKFTSQGAGDESTDILPGKRVPEDLTDYSLGLRASWEVDVWKKLRSAKKAALSRYLAEVEGKNFVITNLVAEVAERYYELQALDAQLAIIDANVALQENALEIVKVQKEAARATALAVEKFAAEVAGSQQRAFFVKQQITETENELNFLLGRFPQPIERSKIDFLTIEPLSIQTGLPSQLLENRPDVRQRELEVTATRFDVKAAKAAFYPRLDIGGAIGFQSFRTASLITFPESLFYNLGADLAAPLINRNALKAAFNSANSRQLQALIEYDQTLLRAFVEVANQQAKIENLANGFSRQLEQVNALNRAIDASNELFKSARVDYFEVLMTQRDALEAKLELVETKQQVLTASIIMYRDLGGGWR